MTLYTDLPVNGSHLPIKDNKPRPEGDYSIVTADHCESCSLLNSNREVAVKPTCNIFIIMIDRRQINMSKKNKLSNDINAVQCEHDWEQCWLESGEPKNTHITTHYSPSKLTSN